MSSLTDLIQFEGAFSSPVCVRFKKHRILNSMRAYHRIITLIVNTCQASCCILQRHEGFSHRFFCSSNVSCLSASSTHQVFRVIPIPVKNIRYLLLPSMFVQDVFKQLLKLIGCPIPGKIHDVLTACFGDLSQQ